MNNTVTYDWLGASVKPRHKNPTISVEFVIEKILKLNFKDFVLNSYGINRYGYHYALADIKLYFSLLDDDTISEKMGIFIEMRGSGCRQYEEYMDGKVNNWTDLFIRLLEENAHFTRIDIANDIYDNSLNVQKIYQCCKEKLCVSRSRLYTYYEKGTLETGEIVGETVNIGEKGGDSQQWSIYNKALEQINSDIKEWVRSELRLFGQKSNEVAKLISTRKPLEEIFFEILNNSYRFIVPSNKSNDKNRWRRPSTMWWNNYLGTEKKTRLEIKRKKRTLETARNYVEKQMSKSLAIVLEGERQAYGDDKAFDYLIKLIEDGGNKITANDRTLISQYALEKNNSSDWGKKY